VSIEDCRALLVNDHSALLELPCFQDSQQLLVISLDDVQRLTEAKLKYLPLHILAQVIKLFSTTEVNNLSIWVIFASTNSKIIHFGTPPAHMRKPRLILSFWTHLTDLTDVSQQIVPHDEWLFPPFNLLQWDVFAKPREELDIFSVGSYDDVIQFGRPL
jgi:hypothetical protein